MTKKFTETKEQLNLFRKLSARLKHLAVTLLLIATITSGVEAQITLINDYQNNVSAPIGTFQGINFREAGFSGLYVIPNTNGKEFWTVSDRGVNVDAANANSAACRPTYDKIYGFANYAPKIHRIRLNADNSIQILQTITMKRPNGTTATGLLNPTGFGSTATEVPSTDTVINCANFNLKTAAKDIWGIDSEGIVVDKDGNFWICEEGGPTIWKLNPNGVVIKRFTPYANLTGAQPEDVQIDSVFKYRKNNRGFEGISITPSGKIYAIIQSPILYPTKSVGEGTRIHRILEIDPATNATQMFAYLNDGIIGASGSNQIRLRDWKIGDMAAVNDHTFLVLEAALRGTSDIKKVYLIDINGATPVTSGLYSGVTLEALVDATGLATNGITPVTKTLFIDLLANGWPSALDKAEGIAIINDSTIAINNDNDFGQYSPLENGIATATTNLSHVFVYGLSGSNKLVNYQPTETLLSQGITGPSTAQSPYLLANTPGGYFKSILTAGDVVNGYKMAGTPDGTGAFDNGDGTFTLLVNHEFGNTVGVVRAHGAKGAFVSKWVINKSDLSVVSGADLIHTVKLWNGVDYNTDSTSALVAFARFCSADLPSVSAFYDSTTGMGTSERIFMNGEENGNEGRAFAHIATGPNAGTTYELPFLGKLSYENSVANPASGIKTVVASMDDSTPGQVYIYVGTKTNTGTEIDKTGLNNGKLFGVSVAGLFTETSSSVPSPGTAFSLVDLGSVQNITGATLNTNSNIAGVTTFLRPEDGSWDPSNPNDFYFATTNAFTSPSRLWKLHFTDITNPELGGTITAVLDGTEGQKMLDNLTIDNHGHILLQEDVGGNVHIGKIWQYTIITDEFKEIGAHDTNRFIAGASNFLTQDEEASGIINVENILGRGMFLLVDQAHYAFPDAGVVEGGQILAFYNPDTNCGFAAGNISGPTNACAYAGNAGSVATYTIDTNDESNLVWSVPAKATLVSGQGTNTIQVKYSNSFVSGVIGVNILSSCKGDSVTRSISINKSKPTTPVTINGPLSICTYIGSDSLATYSIEPVTDALSYLWTVPAHVKLVSGQGTTVIKVLFKEGFVTSFISVKAISACGASANRGVKISSEKPYLASGIFGPAYGICTPSNTVVYSVSPAKFATSYSWSTTIAGTTIVSDSTTATITFPSFVTGQVSVSANNSCGSSKIRNLKVYATPAASASISGDGTVCSGSLHTYYADSVAGALSYTWSVPQGSVIQSGAGTQTISLWLGNNGGDLRVRAINACGVSAPKRLPIVVENCTAFKAASHSTSVYPVPTTGSVQVNFFTPQNESYQLYVTDIITGQVVFRSGATSTSGENTVTADLGSLYNGYYFIHLISSSVNYNERIEIRK